MATEFNKITFTVTRDMEPLMDKAKQLFYDRTQSEMIRTLIIAGLDAIETKKQIEPPCNSAEDHLRST